MASRSMPRFYLSLFVFLSVTVPQTAAIPDSASLVSFLDGLIHARMNDKHIAGATLSIVKDDRIMLLKGYGYADVENQIPVDPKNTLFRVGSISKLFTWTAIMQLYEEGKIDLQDDIRQYFKEGIFPNNYEEVITIKHLMTHTAGFEDEIFNLFATEASSLRPYAELIEDEMPARVRAPGKYSSYSNHGTGMAAHIVEKVSGMTFDEYVEANIIHPLYMRRCTFRQPLPEEQSEHMSKGYTYSNGSFNEQDFEYVPLAAVGAASASAESMARLMQAYLNQGTLSGYSLLDTTTFRLMRSIAHQHHPEVNAMFYGFMDYSRNGQLAFGHGGDTFWFHSIMAMLPDHNLGFFLSFNSEAGGGTTGDIWNDFMDYLFPEELEQLELPDQDEIRKFEGEYVANRTSHDDFLKVGRFMSVIEVSTNEEGFLISEGEDKEYWIQNEGNVFRNRDDSRTLVFEEEANGQITKAFLSNAPIVAFDKLEGIDKIGIQMNLLMLTIGLCLLTFLYWLCQSYFRKSLNVKANTQSGLPKLIKRLTWTCISLILIFYGGFLVLASNPNEIVYGIGSFGKFIFSLTIIVAILALILLYLIARMWMHNRTSTSLWRRIAISIVWLCIVCVIWQWNYWNLLGWQFG